MTQITLSFDVEHTLTEAELEAAIQEAANGATRSLLMAPSAGGGYVANVTQIDHQDSPPDDLADSGGE